MQTKLILVKVQWQVIESDVKTKKHKKKAHAKRRCRPNFSIGHKIFQNTRKNLMLEKDAVLISI
jgi:hypothetical protein